MIQEMLHKYIKRHGPIPMVEVGACDALPYGHEIVRTELRAGGGSVFQVHEVARIPTGITDWHEACSAVRQYAEQENIMLIPWIAGSEIVALSPGEAVEVLQHLDTPEAREALCLHALQGMP